MAGRRIVGVSFRGEADMQRTERRKSAAPPAHALERQQALREASDQARIAAGISRAQLREGRADFLVVLDAERTLAGAEADLAQADAQVAETQIDLFRALGGGWQNSSV